MRTNKTLFQKIVVRKKGESLNQTFLNRNNVIKTLIIVVTILLIYFFQIVRINSDNDFVLPPIQVGGVWPHKSLVAEYTFPIYKSKHTYLQEVNKVQENVPPVFVVKSNALAETLSRLDSIWYKLVETNFNENVWNELFYHSKSRSFLVNLSSDKINELQRIFEFLREKLRFYFSKGVLDTNINELKKSEIVLVSEKSNNELIVPTKNLFDISRLVGEIKIEVSKKFKSDLTELIEELIKKVIVYPIHYSPQLTAKKVELAVLSVPKTIGFVKAGEIIVEKGKKITEVNFLKLNSYKKVKLMTQKDTLSIWMFLGSLLNVIFVYSIIFIYLFILRKRIFTDNLQFGIINFCLVVVSFLSWLSITIPSDLPLGYIILLPALSILIAIVFDSRTAFYSTVTMAVFVALIRGNDFETASALLFSGVISAYSVRDIQNRSQMFRSMVFIEIGFLVPILAFSLEKSSEWLNFTESLSISTLNAVVSPVVTYGLLFIIEKYSNITTDLKLKEFDNLNHPLLKRLSEIAPGTYQHTMQLAMLAESCASAIGANTLLTRVGAYFHDIGKLYNPEYFIENQIDGENKHEFISPRRSAEAIREHVLKGIEIAKEFNLPQRIADFIPMHHGTSLIKHFYALALEEAKEKTVDESIFRYPGPKPNNKETVIVMICDSAEAMSRLSNRTREELANMVHKVIQDKMLDGQFDESNITMNDLKIIEEVVVRILFGSTHARVEYKEIPKPLEQNLNE
ncbi:MAG: HD family phosphohydrolase [Candidatus Kapaibacteriales bacterium]